MFRLEERIASTIRNIGTLEDLAQFERNARARNQLTDEMKDALRARSADLGRAMISVRAGLDLTDLSPAEEKIVQAVSEYVGVMKRNGKDATRTLNQLRNRELIVSYQAPVRTPTTMSRKPSLPQPVKSVSEALTPDRMLFLLKEIAKTT